MAPTPFLSVIIPLFNGARYIESTLDSLLEQAAPDLEVIVVDDGSTDDGPDLVRSHPLQAQLVIQPHLGVAVARNRGSLLARGEWLAFLDQDDLWHRERVSRMRPVLEATSAGCVLTGIRTFAIESDRVAIERANDGAHEMVDSWLASDEDVTTLRRTVLPSSNRPSGHPNEQMTVAHVMQSTVSPTTSFFVRPNHLHLAGGWSLHARSIDDWWLMGSLAALEPIVVVDEPSHLYRIHSRATSRSTKFWYAYASSLIAMRYGGNYVPTNTALTTPVDNPTVLHMALAALSVEGASAAGTDEFTRHALALLLPGQGTHRLVQKQVLLRRAPWLRKMARRLRRGE